MKTYIIGDIHGNLKALNKMIKMIPMDNNEDKIVFLGDYVDRGDNSYKVIQKLQSLQRKYPDRVICLMGNHEALFLDYLEVVKEVGYATYTANYQYFGNGGQATILSYEKANANILKHYDWLKNLPLYYEGKTFIAVHAGLRGGRELSKQTRHDLTWIRDEFHNLPEGTFDKSVIFGHTFVDFLEPNNDYMPVLINGNVAIDTGAVWTNVLTCAVIENEEELVDFIQTR